MADPTGQNHGVDGTYYSSSGQFTISRQVGLPTRMQGLGNFPMDMNHLEQLADYVAHITGGSLPDVLTRLARDITATSLSTPGINNNNILFPAADDQKPFSIDFFQVADPFVVDDITGDQTGITIDNAVGQVPAQDDALGGVALRSKLKISRGEATNFRRVLDFTFQIASVGAGGARPFFGMSRRAAPDGEHNMLYVERTGNSVVLQANVHDAANPANRGEYTLPIGSRTGNDNTFHFRVGDIVRMVIEMEKPNYAGTDATQNLRFIITAHRLNNAMQIVETLQYNDFSVVANNDADATNRNRIFGKIADFNYNNLYFYPSDAGLNYILPMVGIEGWQWKSTINPRDFLHHADLVSRSRLPVSASHRLLGFYQDLLTDLLSFHAPINITSDSQIDGGQIAKTGFMQGLGNAALVVPEGFAGYVKIDVNNSADAQSTTLPSRASVEQGWSIVVTREAKANNQQNVEISRAAGSDDQIKGTDGNFANTYTLGAGQSSTIDYVEFVANTETDGNENWLITHHYAKQAPVPTSGISELFQGDVVVTNQARPLILNVPNANIPAAAEAGEEFHFYMRGPNNLIIEFGTITKANFDAADTLANRTNNGANRNRAFLSEKVGGITYYLLKAANNTIDFIMHPDAGNTDSVTGTYVLTIHRLSAAAAARIGVQSSGDLVAPVAAQTITKTADTNVGTAVNFAANYTITLPAGKTLADYNSMICKFNTDAYGTGGGLVNLGDYNDLVFEDGVDLVAVKVADATNARYVIAKGSGRGANNLGLTVQETLATSNTINVRFADLNLQGPANFSDVALTNVWFEV